MDWCCHGNKRLAFERSRAFQFITIPAIPYCFPGLQAQVRGLLSAPTALSSLPGLKLPFYVFSCCTTNSLRAGIVTVSFTLHPVGWLGAWNPAGPQNTFTNRIGFLLLPPQITVNVTAYTAQIYYFTVL